MHLFHALLLMKWSRDPNCRLCM